MARREIAFALEVEGPAHGLPDSLLLSADMTHMNHGPARTQLRRLGTHYSGAILFVMGGAWELSLFEGERLVLRGAIEVHEN